MTTTYTFDATIAEAPVRRTPASPEPTTAESSRRITRTFAKTALISATAVAVASAALFVHIDNPSTNRRGCTFSASLHNSLMRPDVRAVGY